jgi:hypothetical protein
MFLKSLTVKLGGSWNNIAPNFFVVLKGEILSRNSSKYVMAPLLTSNRLTCVMVSGTWNVLVSDFEPLSI